MKNILLLFLVFGIFIGCTGNKYAMKTEYTDDGLWIYENDEAVLFYNAMPKSIDGDYSRANYIHPLYDLNGAELTEDFPEDHFHQRGIFWTWHQIWIGDKRIGDGWLCKDFSWNVVEAKATADSDRAVINTKVFWQSPLWLDDNGKEIPFVEEQGKIIVHKATPQYRCIDFEIALRALEPNVSIGGSEDVKGYGGFSPRIVLADDIVFSDQDSVVTPITQAIAAGPWIDMMQTVEGTESGFTMMQHPDNPDYVQKWILRAKKSMQNPVYPGAEPVAISMETPTVLKYRVVLHDGDADIAEIFDDYCGM